MKAKTLAIYTVLQESKKPMAVFSVKENVLSCIAAQDYMIYRSGIMYSCLAWHGENIIIIQQDCNPDPIWSSDPIWSEKLAFFIFNSESREIGILSITS